MQKRLPNLIISGVVKGGTTSIFSYLSAHPDICASTIKETCFFHGLRYGYELDKLEKYLSYFQQCMGQQYVIEATPGYFEGGRRLAEGMSAILGQNLKIILVLREPVSRLISFFRFKKSMLELQRNITLDEYYHRCLAMTEGEKKLQKNDMWWGVDGGIYCNYLKDWLECYEDNIKVIFFDDLKNSPGTVVAELCDWLGIDPGYYNNYIFEVENKGAGYNIKLLQKLALTINSVFEPFWRKHPQVKSALRRYYYFLNGRAYEYDVTDNIKMELNAFYLPYNRETGEILLAHGYAKLPSWLR